MNFGGAAENPFCASRFAPGVLPWFGGELEGFVERAMVPRVRLQILGPQGSGKSTLMVQLERRARRAGWSVVRVRGSGTIDWGANARLWLVDEYEELSWWQRVRLRWLCARQRVSLVVTAHRAVGMTTLCERTVSPEIARRVVAELVAERGQLPVPGPVEVAAALGRHAGNLREVLFELYDQVERNAANSGRVGPAVDAAG